MQFGNILPTFQNILPLISVSKALFYVSVRRHCIISQNIVPFSVTAMRTATLTFDDSVHAISDTAISIKL
jgi:hypothetical protein